MSNQETVAFPEPFAHIFMRLPPQDVEQFFQAYQLWTLQKRIELQKFQIETLEQHIVENAEQMFQTTPSAIVLAALAQLQSNGVNDVDLLDRMLDRGENWLDSTMQLLERCESLDMIQGDYSLWCENALDGAYNWMLSMSEASQIQHTQSNQAGSASQEEHATEAQLLEKLMSEDGIITLDDSLDEEPAIAENSPLLASEQISSEADQKESILEPSTAAKTLSSASEQVVYKADLADSAVTPAAAENVLLPPSKQVIYETNQADGSITPADSEQTSYTVTPATQDISTVQEEQLSAKEASKEPEEDQAPAPSNQANATLELEADPSDPADTLDSTDEQTDLPIPSMATKPTTIGEEEAFKEAGELTANQDEDETGQLEAKLVEAVEIDTAPLEAISIEVAESPSGLDLESVLCDNALIEAPEETTDTEEEPSKATQEVHHIKEDSPKSIEEANSLQTQWSTTTDILEGIDTSEEEPGSEPLAINLSLDTASQVLPINRVKSLEPLASEKMAPIEPAEEAKVLEKGEEDDNSTLEANEAALEKSPSTIKLSDDESLALTPEPDETGQEEISSVSKIAEIEQTIAFLDPDEGSPQEAAITDISQIEDIQSQEDQQDTDEIRILKITSDSEDTTILPALQLNVDSSQQITQKTEAILQPEAMHSSANWEDHSLALAAQNLLEVTPTQPDLPAQPAHYRPGAAGSPAYYQEQNRDMVQQTQRQKKRGFWARLWTMFWEG